MSQSSQRELMCHVPLEFAAATSVSICPVKLLSTGVFSFSFLYRREP